MATNIKDIARLAGVSHMTVSRVINNSENVKPQTRDMILKIIDEQQYIPSASARALISGKSQNIGVLIMYDLSQFPSDFLSPILEGISSTLMESGYNTALYFDQIKGKRNLAPTSIFNKNQMDGLIVVSVEKENEVKNRISEVKLPIVLVNQSLDMAGVSYVTTDDFGGAYTAVQHLIELGHQKIAMLCGTAKFSTSAERRRGYEQAMYDAGLLIQNDFLLPGDFNKNRAYEQVKKLLQKRDDVTGIFAANDVMALGAYKAIKEKGLLIPNDISVVGYDNQEYCDLVEPALTTVSKHRRLMGEKAAEVMLQGLEMQMEQKIVLKSNLVVRNSTTKV